jgi:hypothetical protein
MSIQTYDLDQGRGWDEAAFLTPTPDGDWVKHEDHLSEVERLKAQLAGLQTLSDSYKSNYGSALDRERIHLAQLAAVTAPVTDAELSPYSASGSRGYMLICSADVTELIASRLAQVPTNGPCSVCGDGDGKGYCPVHNPGVKL